jgi:carboxypeptidase PM20D1
MWILLGVAVLLFLAVLVVRGLAFKPAPRQIKPTQAAQVDEEAITRHMQAMIRLKTVSYRDKSLEDDAPFEAFIDLLPGLYPRVHAAITRERIGTRGLLYHWQGKTAAAPSVYMSHFDVVPAEEAAWEKPPFEAVLEDGVLWGRGTLDTKGTLLGILEAAEALLAQGFVPQNDVYFAFGGDEEIRGGAAIAIVDALTERGVKPAFVLDEGGAVVENVFPGVKAPCALVGIAEKGSMDARLRLTTRGGHASTPPPHTAVGLMARAIARSEGKPFPFRLTPPAAQMFDTLGRHSSLLYRILFANLWCFRPALNLICRLSGGELNALVRTTCAFTQMRGGEASNVLPPVVTAGANLRLMIGETVQSAKERLSRVSGVKDIEVITGNDPSPVSRTDGEPWQRLGSAIAQTWPDAILSPYLMLAASDSYHYGKVCDSVYRFSAMALSGEERKMIHGHNERVPVATLVKTVQFYQRVMGES